MTTDWIVSEYTVDVGGKSWTFGHVLTDVDGNPVFGIIKGDGLTEEEEELSLFAFVDLVCRPNFEFTAYVGLAGRLGGTKFEKKVVTLEEGMEWAVEVLLKEFLTPGGEFYGVDAIR